MVFTRSQTIRIELSLSIIRYGIIYRYTSPRDKTYIGKTLLELDKRFEGHVQDSCRYRSQRLICKEIRRHIKLSGINSVRESFEIIRDNVNEFKLCKTEKIEIIKDQRRNGYNNLNMIGGSKQYKYKNRKYSLL